MIDQTLYTLDEAVCPRKSRMSVEGGFVNPARMEKEEARVAHGAKRLDGNAARFAAHARHNFPEFACHGVLFTVPSMKPGENHQRYRHAFSSSPESSWPDTTAQESRAPYPPSSLSMSSVAISNT
jgi:hypothetical protein